jgi:hypothetical protein
MLLIVESLDGRLGVGVSLHLNEGKSLALSGVAIHNDVGAADGAILAKQLF